MRVNLIVPCGGSGERAHQGKNKLLSQILGKPLIIKTLEKFLPFDTITKIILPCRACDNAEFAALVSTLEDSRIILCESGASRCDSVAQGLRKIEPNADIIIIHDGARPFVTHDIIANCIATAARTGSAITAIPVTDTIVTTLGDTIESVIPRETLRRIQTPQGFRAQEIMTAYAKRRATSKYTDDSSVYLDGVGDPTLIDGSEDNIKITYAEDFEAYGDVRVGCGYDTHQLVEGRKLVIGGVDIPHDKGLLGHSDADVLTHAIMDALLTACNERDIGVLFPDTDDRYKDISSLTLLRSVRDIIYSKDYHIINISAVIMVQQPKLARYIPLMTNKLAETLGIEPTQIALSATTTEGLGFIGREEGIATSATCAVRQD